MVRVPTPGRSSGGDSDDAEDESDASRSSSPGNSSTRTERVSRRAQDRQRDSSESLSSGGSQSGSEESMEIDDAPREDAAEVNRATPDPRVERGARRARDAEQEAVMETEDVRTRTEAAERFRDERERERRESLRTGAGAGVTLGGFATDDLRFEPQDDGGATVKPTESAARERARQQIAEENPGVEPEDIDSLERTDDGYRATIEREQQGPTRADLDPLTALAVPEGRVEDAATGEERIEQLAEDGSPSARVFEAGSTIQAASQDFGENVRAAGEKVVDSPLIPAAAGAVTRDPAMASRTRRALDAEVGSADASVGEQVSSGAAGLAEFPGLVAGGAVQATSLPGVAEAQRQRTGESPDVSGADFAEATTRGATQQAALVRDRPVEAATILAPVAISSGRARVRGRSGSGVSRSTDSIGLESQTRPGGRLKTEAGSLRERGPRSDIADFRTQTQASRQARKSREAGLEFREGLDRFIQDESGQAQLGGRKSRSRSRSRSESQETVDPAGRPQSPDFDPRIFERNRGRGPGRSEGVEPEVGARRPARGGDRSDLRQDIQRARRQPETDLRAATDFSDVAAAQRGGPNVVPGAVNRLERAQEPQVRLDDTLNPTVEDIQPAAVEPEVSPQQDQQLRAERPGKANVRQMSDVLAEATSRQGARDRATGPSRGVGADGDLRPASRSRAAELAASDTLSAVVERSQSRFAQQSRGETTGRGETSINPTPTSVAPPPAPNRGGRGRRNFSLPFGDFPQGGQRDYSPADRAALFDNEFQNPVAAPYQWDDVAAEVLGRDEKEEDRRGPMDGLADFPTDSGDDIKDGFDPLEGF
jgi:hypothetical protein